MGFTLSCNRDVMDSIGAEAEKAGTSKTQYINEILRQVFTTPNALTEGTRLDELQAYSRLFSDELMNKIPDLANKERRNPDQMLLYLIERGINSIKEDSI